MNRYQRFGNHILAAVLMTVFVFCFASAATASAFRVWIPNRIVLGKVYQEKPYPNRKVLNLVDAVCVFDDNVYKYAMAESIESAWVDFVNHLLSRGWWICGWGRGGISVFSGIPAGQTQKGVFAFDHLVPGDVRELFGPASADVEIRMPDGTVIAIGRESEIEKRIDVIYGVRKAEGNLRMKISYNGGLWICNTVRYREENRACKKLRDDPVRVFEKSGMRGIEKM